MNRLRFNTTTIEEVFLTLKKKSFLWYYLANKDKLFSLYKIQLGNIHHETNIFPITSKVFYWEKEYLCECFLEFSHFLILSSQFTTLSTFKRMLHYGMHPWDSGIYRSFVEERGIFRWNIKTLIKKIGNSIIIQMVVIWNVIFVELCFVICGHELLGPNTWQ